MVKNACYVKYRFVRLCRKIRFAQGVKMKGLLVDYGGVLTTSVFDSFAAFCVNEDIEPDVLRAVMIDSARTPGSAFNRVEIGAIAQEEFDVEVAALLSDACGREVVARDLKQRLFAGVQPDEAMARALRAARAAGIRTALVSNSWGGTDYPREMLAELLDVLVVSGDVGLRKPDADIYLLAAERAGVAPAECVFVDDLQVNVDGADAAGMTGVLHRDSAQTIARLEDLFGVALRG
jgi:putative hydrolase of the HAD superfamily